jgi:hypothetical protein
MRKRTAVAIGLGLVLLVAAALLWASERRRDLPAQPAASQNSLVGRSVKINGQPARVIMVSEYDGEVYLVTEYKAGGFAKVKLDCYVVGGKIEIESGF